MSTESSQTSPPVEPPPPPFRLVRVRWFQQVKVVDVARTVDALNVADLQKELQTSIETEAPAGTLVLINFRMIGYLQSSAWRKLFDMLSLASARGRSVSICNAPAALATLLETDAYRGTIRVWDDLKEAVQTWNQRDAAKPSATHAATQPHTEAQPAADVPPPPKKRWKLFGRRNNEAAVTAELNATPSAHMANTVPDGRPQPTSAGPATPAVPQPQAHATGSGPTAPTPVRPSQSGFSFPASFDEWKDLVRDFVVDRPFLVGGIGLSIMIVGVAAFLLFVGDSKSTTEAIPTCDAFYAEYKKLRDSDADGAQWGDLKMRVHSKLTPVIAEISSKGEERTAAQGESLAAIRSLFELVEPDLPDAERQRAESQFEKHLEAARSL